MTKSVFCLAASLTLLASAGHADCFYNKFMSVKKGDSICYTDSRKQYRCSEDSEGFYWSYVQKVTLNSTLKDKTHCHVLIDGSATPVGRVK